MSGWRNSELSSDLLDFDKIIIEVGIERSIESDNNRTKENKNPLQYLERGIIHSCPINLNCDPIIPQKSLDLDTNDKITKNVNMSENPKKINQNKSDSENKNKVYHKTQESISPYSVKQMEGYSNLEKESTKHISEWIEVISDPCSEITSQLQATYNFCLPKLNTGETDGVQKNKYLMKETFKSKDGIKCTREVFYTGGMRHGFYREMFPDNKLKMFGRFANGEKVGSQWTWCVGDGYLIGEVDGEDKADGENIVYLYPDLTSCIVGRFVHGNLKSGKLASLNSTSKEFGIVIPEVEVKEDSVSFSYEPSSSTMITASPLRRDPYEERYVYVKDSQTPGAGEGLWAKTKILKGQLFAFFNGVKVHQLHADIETTLMSDYVIKLLDNLDLDIKSADTLLSKYCATLVHKTCHSFTPNCTFTQVWHPRFGLIMSLTAKHDIYAGEEVFVSYNYKLGYAPQWYQQQWFNHLRENLNWTETKISEWTMNKVRVGGIPIEIPPPLRDSERYVPCAYCNDHVWPYNYLLCTSCGQVYHSKCDLAPELIMEEGWTCSKCTAFA